MAQFAVILERNLDETWSAFSTDPECIGGVGATREDAIADWTQAMTAWLLYMRESGQAVTVREVVSVEVAA